MRLRLEVSDGMWGWIPIIGGDQLGHGGKIRVSYGSQWAAVQPIFRENEQVHEDSLNYSVAFCEKSD